MQDKTTDRAEGWSNRGILPLPGWRRHEKTHRCGEADYNYEITIAKR